MRKEIKLKMTVFTVMVNGKLLEAESLSELKNKIKDNV